MVQQIGALTALPSRGPGFDCQDTHGGSQLSVTPVLEDPTHSSDSTEPDTQMVHIHTCR